MEVPQVKDVDGAQQVMSNKFIPLKLVEKQTSIGSSKVGGTALLADECKQPLDKNAQPMKLLVQLNFQQFTLPGSWLPEQGLLAVFVSEDMQTCLDKDRNCFKVIWQPNLIGTPNMVPSEEVAIALEHDAHWEAQSTLISEAQSDATEGATATSLEEKFVGDKLLHGSYLLGEHHARLEEAKQISAFSCNGITYNETRAKDDCYSHLVLEAEKWHLLLRLLLEDGTDFLLMIHQDNLVNERFDKSWLIRFYRE